MKKFVCGFVLGGLLFTSVPGFAQGLYKTISVKENSINLFINGNRINENNYIINNTTFVPLRVVSEALGQKVTWDGKTNSVKIGEDISTTAVSKYKQILQGSTLYTILTDNGYSEVHTMSQEAEDIWNTLTEEEKGYYLQARVNELRLKAKASTYFYHIFDSNEKNFVFGTWNQDKGFKWEYSK